MLFKDEAQLESRQGLVINEFYMISEWVMDYLMQCNKNEIKHTFSVYKLKIID